LASCELLEADSDLGLAPLPGSPSSFSSDLSNGSGLDSGCFSSSLFTAITPLLSGIFTYA